MYITATFHGNDIFTHLLDTDKLPINLKQEVENAVKVTKNAEFFDKKSFSYFQQLQVAIVFPKDVLPATLEAMIDVFAD